jgi:hypothetical protein
LRMLKKKCGAAGRSLYSRIPYHEAVVDGRAQL